jgi:hypothetical protein
MTNKELAAVERLKHELRLARAWKMTDPVTPDIPIPDYMDGIKNGYLYNAYSARIEKACTSAINHNFGGWDKTTTQQPRELYSTPILAIRAMRYEMEREFLNKLAAVDKLIEAELAK